VAPGLIVMAVILTLGNLSGAHLNPAVTLGFAARGYFPWRRVPGYIAAQLLGAVSACAVLDALFGHAGDLGMAAPGAGVSDVAAFAMEALLTFGLATVILGTAAGARNTGPLSALAVGGYIALAGLWSSPITGALMNPARALGPDMVMWRFPSVWAYVLGPISGALAAVLLTALLLGGKGRGEAEKAAQGEPPGSDE
jgi:aquaporin Z